MKVGSLFAGIGGFDLGLERAGMRTIWQVEQEPFRRAVLARHFPDAKRYEDVREVGAHNLEWVDLICGGFPCQDISIVGRRIGIDGENSGLWSEMGRIVGELRPRYVVVENVANLLVRGLGRVLGDLAALGYDAEWDCIPASAFGAPHRRDRLWLVAYPAGEQHQGDPPQNGWPTPALISSHRGDQGRPLDDTLCGRHGASPAALRPGRKGALDAGGWAVEPDVGRVADGVPARVDRLSALGDALVPQIAEWIGQRILSYEQNREQLAA